MAKLLLLLVIVLAAAWLLRRPRGGGKPPGRAHRPPVQPMVECVHCGLHLPLDDALPDAAGRLFCSEAHRLAGPR